MLSDGIRVFERRRQTTTGQMHEKRVLFHRFTSFTVKKYPYQAYRFHGKQSVRKERKRDLVQVLRTSFPYKHSVHTNSSACLMSLHRQLIRYETFVPWKPKVLLVCKNPLSSCCRVQYFRITEGNVILR